MSAFRRAVPFALVLIAALSASAAAQGQKFAYITSSRLLAEAPGRASAESLFAREAQPMQDQIKRMSDSLDAMMGAYQKRAASLTTAQRDAQMKDIETKQLSYQQRARDLQEKQNARQNELVQPILDKIKQAIEDVRVEGGYAFIFNADQGSPIVAVDKNLDVTERVLARLRSGQVVVKPTAPAPSPSGVTRPTTPPPAE
jgi:outer membrane protein